MLNHLLESISYLAKLTQLGFKKSIIYKVFKIFKKVAIDTLKVLPNCNKLAILLITYSASYQ